MVNLDVKDRKLLYYLSRDARQSNTQLARLVGLSKNAVRYRIDRLRNEGVIKSFASTLDLGTIGYDTFPILMKFNEDLYDSREIIDYFLAHPFVSSAGSLSGRWDLFVEFVFKDTHHINALISQILTHFGERLCTYQTFHAFADPLRVEHLPTEFYSDLELEELPASRRIPQQHTLDDVDRKVLHELNRDSSQPFLTIAQQVGVSIDVVRYRMKILTDKAVILKFFPEVSLGSLGYTEYVCQIRLKDASSERLNKIKKRIQNHGSITYGFFDITSYTLFFISAFKNASQIDHLFRHLRKDFHDIIDDQEYMIQKEMFKFNLFPDGLLEHVSETGGTRNAKS